MSLINIHDHYKSRLTSVVSTAGVVLCLLLAIVEMFDPVPLPTLVASLFCAVLIFAVIRFKLSSLEHYWYGALGINIVGTLVISASCLSAVIPNLSGGYLYFTVIVVTSTFLCGAKIGAAFLVYFYALTGYLAASQGVLVSGSINIDTSIIFDRIVAPTFSYYILMTANNSLNSSISIYDKQSRELKTKEKLASLGVFIGGIAHEVRNPVSIVLGALKRLEKIINQLNRLPEDEAKMILKLTNVANRSGKRIANIVESLVFLASNENFVETSHTLKTSVIAGIQDAMMICQEKLDQSKVTFEVDLGEQDYLVAGDAYHLSSVVRIIVDNAIDALNEQQGEEPMIRLHLSCQDHLELWIQDNGPGIPMDLQDKIMDPFFTTKDVGKGTGIGLALVMGVAQHLDWDISFTSEPGETSFIIKFKYFKDLA